MDGGKQRACRQLCVHNNRSGAQPLEGQWGLVLGKLQVLVEAPAWPMRKRREPQTQERVRTAVKAERKELSVSKNLH